MHTLEQLNEYLPYKGWNDYTERNIADIKNRDCVKCYYASRYDANVTNKTAMTCDYLLITGHMRGCLPGTCRENGKFKIRTKKRVVKPKNIRI